jgi:Ni,Fe-hydrogenase III large subunit
MTGSRQASEFTLFAPLRRLVARAVAQDLRALVVPGPDVAMARGLDLAAAGLQIADSPRTANLLLLVGPLPASLMDAVSIAYAQMPRPRAILALGVDDAAPLPPPEASGPVTQDALQTALATVRKTIAADAFAAKLADYDAPALQTRIQYTCPMHPEVVRDEPGNCPICGMFLVPSQTSASPDHDHAAMSTADGGADAVAPRAVSAGGHDADPAAGATYACPMHPEVTSNEPGSCPKCGMDLVATDGGDAAAYTCPMHPEVTSDEPGSCPKCGMDLVATGSGDSGEHNHHGHAHQEPAPAYTCPMHPEVTSDAPGSCPKCGMDLVATDGGDEAAYACPMHPEVTSDKPGSCPKCGMDLVATGGGDGGEHNHHGHAHQEPAPAYTCPMHPEVTSDEPGSCPKCGMDLVATDGGDEAAYACPMHPEVTSDKPGSCPKCGMDLVATGGGDGGEHNHHGHAHQEPAPAYTCPMHPEVTSDEPGSCPKCGMDLVATDGGGAAAYACPMHPEVTSDKPGSCPKCGMDLVATGGGGAAAYACPMHPEVTSDEPGSCPKCGMDLVATGGGDHSHHAHAHHAHGHTDAHDNGDNGNAGEGLIGLEPGFMSMIEMTEGTPRSSDGLQMEWIEAPFGPFFPGLPGGLTLVFTLDGDSVVTAATGSLVGTPALAPDTAPSVAQFVTDLQARMPLAPVSYGLLACRAIEAAARAPAALERARDAALERERIASHLIWLAQMGRQVGLVRIAQRATALHLLIRDADQPAIRALMPTLNALLAQVRDTRFLVRRMAVVGALPAEADWSGPASPDNSAAGRLAARLAEISTSIGKIDAAPAITPPRLDDVGKFSGQGQASVATPRGPASLEIEIVDGKVTLASLQTPSARHLALVEPLSEQRELADALVAVASLDLDPWEIGA